MSALLDLLVAAPWAVDPVGERHDIIALAQDGTTLGRFALDVPGDVVEHIVDNHNREIERLESCDLCSSERPGKVYISSVDAWADAACGGQHA